MSASFDNSGTLDPNREKNSACNCISNNKLDYCECCNGIKTFTPMNIENPPSLSTIRYRIGTHGMFKTSMLANMSKVNNFVLRKLTTRQDNDLAIAIIDAWASIADVITFYQERIANEGFLRTATERISVLELARSVGYELGAGVASDTFLVFTIEENNPSIEKSLIDKGTKVQSIPQQGETPAIFETVEKIEARPELNAIKANSKLPHYVNRNTKILYFEGVETKLRSGDGLLIINKKSQSNYKYFAKVINVELDEIKKITKANIQIIWPPKNRDANTSSNTNTNMPDGILHFGSDNEVSSHGNETPELTADPILSTSKFPDGEIKLPQYMSMSIKNDVSEKEFLEGQNRAAEMNIKSLAPEVYAFRQKASIFGHNVPSYDAIKSSMVTNSSLTDWDDPQLRIYQKVNVSSPFENYAPAGEADRPIIFLDAVYENLLNQTPGDVDKSNNWVIFNLPDGETLPCQIESVREETLVEYAITGRVSGIRLQRQTLNQLDNFKRRNTTVFIQSERLELAQQIDQSPVQDNFVELEQATAGLKNGQVVIITGEILDEFGDPSGKTAAEYRTVREVTTVKISFDRNLENKYLRESVQIYANVSMATHGETKTEVLGSGDPIMRQQSFTLKQKPLTFIKASTPSGAASTLEIRVDDILWKGVDYLYSYGPKDRVFVSQNDDSGNTNIVFGDGIRGARPSLGVENITAKYRTGTGKEGLLKQGQLSLLMDRPLGVKSVTNPFPTGAAEDPENLESARVNAPLKVLTMNRIVSILDFANFTRSLAGIGKAKASEIWNGSKTVVHLSVATSSGSKLDPIMYDSISKSIERFKDPHIPFIIDSFIKKTFSLAAKIKINDDMLTDKVLLSVRNTILDIFSFEKRELAQPLEISEVVTLIQNINGVEFVDIDELHIDDVLEEHPTNSISSENTATTSNSINKAKEYLPCSSAYYDNSLEKIIPAEILIVNPEGVTLLAID